MTKIRLGRRETFTPFDRPAQVLIDRDMLVAPQPEKDEPYDDLTRWALKAGNKKLADRRFPMPDLREQFRGALRGQTLIHLGGGDGSFINSPLVRALAPETYVCVDMAKGAGKVLKQWNPAAGMPRRAFGVQGDFLRLVSHLPRGSASFLISNVGDAFVGADGYLEALANEIALASRAQGLVMGDAGALADPLVKTQMFKSFAVQAPGQVLLQRPF